MGLGDFLVSAPSSGAPGLKRSAEPLKDVTHYFLGHFLAARWPDFLFRF